MLCSISAFAQKRITFKIEKLSTPENFLYLQSYDDIYKRLIMSETEVFSKEVEKQEKNPPFNIIAKSEAPDSLVSYRYHSFFQGMYQAYAEPQTVCVISGHDLVVNQPRLCTTYQR